MPPHELDTSADLDKLPTMKLEKAHRLLLEKMEEHGLTDSGWTVQLDNAKRRFGFCALGTKVISLSSPLSEANPKEEVLDTILHEIAHALAYVEHKEDCGHDERWKTICRRIGARPEACYDESDVIIPDAHWALVHSETGEVFESFQRKPDKDFSQIWIRGRKEETIGKLEIRPNSIGKINKFDRPVLQRLNEELMDAIKTVIEGTGLTVGVTSSKFSQNEFDLGLCFRTELPDGITPEQHAFEEIAFVFSLKPSDYHRVFVSRGKSYLLVGLKPNNRKYPIIGLCPRTGKRFKFEWEVLEALEPKS